MKKTLWLALLLPVFSSSGGIPLNITGNIYYLPCDVSTDTKYQEVNFGPLLNIDFQTAGNASEWKSFYLNVENCPAGTTKATVKFDGVIDVDDARHFPIWPPAMRRRISHCKSPVAITLLFIKIRTR